MGFKYFGNLVADLETQLLEGDEHDPDLTTCATDVTGQETVFGKHPRMLIMAEESGGAALGPDDWQLSREEERATLAIKEKDGMQIGTMSLGLAARLDREGSSFAEYYMERLEHYSIVHRFYERLDVTLYDESLMGEERSTARQAGNQRKEETVAFFAGLEGRTADEVAVELRRRLPDDAELPDVVRCFNAGDGTLIEFAGQWFELRASGTDAVLRYYMEGVDSERVMDLNKALHALDLN